MGISLTFHRSTWSGGAGGHSEDVARLSHFCQRRFLYFHNDSYLTPCHPREGGDPVVIHDVHRF